MTKLNEHAEQATFVALVGMTYQLDETFARELFFAVPNGAWLGGKSFAMYQKLNAEGVRPGVADILYLQPRGPYAYLAIEMKAPENRNRPSAVSPVQKDFLEAVRKNGGYSIICYSSEDAMAEFDKYMRLPFHKQEN
jgi:hypothetical protein